LVAEWVSTHLPQDLKWAIAGRNAKKLQDVVDELKKRSPERKQPGEDLPSNALFFVIMLTELQTSRLVS
jgi:hypothetical protein